MRSGMLDVMSSDYIRTARAKGLAFKLIVARHAMKNAMLSVVTVIALDLGSLLAGALVTETVFNWPGVGLLLVDAIQGRDYAIVQMIVLITSVVYVSVNLLADIAVWVSRSKDTLRMSESTQEEYRESWQSRRPRCGAGLGCSGS